MLFLGRPAAQNVQTAVCGIWHDRSMTNGEQISITLSPAQVDQVVRAAGSGGTPGFAILISNALSQTAKDQDDEPTGEAQHGEPSPSESPGEEADGGYFPTLDDRRLSRSLLRGLAVLTCFNGHGDTRGIIELSKQLEMSPSTTHRYVTTLVELGLLERCPKTRKYRLANV
jgi:hypothetical protein